MPTVRIAHLSDLHASKDNRAALPILRAAIEDLAEAHRERAIDIVTFSGDLARKGLPSDYEAAHDGLIEPLREALELDLDRLILVPGNHDVDRDKIDPYQEDGLRGRLSDAGKVADLIGDPKMLASATHRLDAWNEYYDMLADGQGDVQATPLGTTRQIQLDGATVGIASLNTAWRSVDDEDKQRLMLGEPQYQLALEQIAACDLRIVVMHHPLTWLAPFDADAARGAFEGMRTLVLSGHEHQPDPTSELSLRGGAIYSRAGCLYENPKSLNGFTLIDVDLTEGIVDFRLRTWYEARKAFDQATHLAKKGRREFAWVERSNLPAKAVYTSVLDALASRAIDLCALTAGNSELEAPTPDDILVEPRLWPAPHKEIAAARSVEGTTEPVPSDPLAVLDKTRVLVVVGEPEAGVSSTLVWVLSRHFAGRGTHTPVSLAYDGSFKQKKFEGETRHELRSVGQPVAGNAELPPCIFAFDDVKRDAGLEQLAKYISSQEHHLFVLGCHRDDYEGLQRELTRQAVEFDTLHIGPLGRSQVRSLIEKYGGSSGDVERIFALIVQQHLPRSPLIIAALIVVLREDQDPSSFNPSALLNACVGVLLRMDDGSGGGKQRMDVRQREHLLSWLAGEMARDQVTRLPPRQVHEILAQYFRDRGLAEWLAPGDVVRSLLARHILVQDGNGIGFRHGTLMDLFVGKRINEDPGFATEVLADPLSYEKALGHAAGLRRDDLQLLTSIRNGGTTFVGELPDDLSVDLFDLVKDRQGWSDEDPDLDDLKVMIGHREDEADEVDEADRDKALDRLYDDVEYHEDTDEPPERLQTLAPYVSLLSEVLRNSELVADVALKKAALEDALHGWSLIAIVMAVEEDQSSEIRERLNSEAVAEVLEKDPGLLDSTARMTELISVMLMAFSIAGALASPHLETVTRGVVEDTEFMQPTAHALFATMLYVLMRFPDWVSRLTGLYDTHGEHPLVKALVFALATTYYRSPTLSEGEARQLEDFLTATAETRAKKGTGGVVQGIVKSKVRQELRDTRQKALMAAKLKTITPTDDLLPQ